MIMNNKKYTVLISYSFNGVAETLDSGVMSKGECDEFVEEVINEKEWVKVNKCSGTENESSKYINVHNIASMEVVKLVKDGSC